MKRAYIFGGGVYGKEFPEIKEGDLIIAADKGNDILKIRGIVPHLVIGDFDSASEIPTGEHVTVLPVEKDVTDCHAATDRAIAEGCDEIYIYGGMGGRPDHSFANFTLICSLVEKGVKSFLVGEGYTVTAVKNGKISLYGENGKTVSVFSWTEKSEGVTFEGLKYELHNAVLTSGFALGVSNAFIENEAEISVKEGLLLVMWEN